MKLKLSILLLVSVLFFSCKSEKKEIKTDYTKIEEQAKSLFKSLPKEAINKENPQTPEKIALGKKLYFEKALSKDNTQSCNTCHNVATYGVDNKSFSEGNNGSLGGRNSPTTFNAALHIAQFWDGREPDVEAQAGGPILNPVEMEMASKEEVINRLSKLDNYTDLFAKAFPKEKEALSYTNLTKAIGAFERTLLTPSKFDDFLNGNSTALNDVEKEGLKNYIDAGCVACHSGALLGGNMYQKFGLIGDYWKFTKSKKIDEGRFEVTKEDKDKYFFKVPSLRNIEKTYPYFHDGIVQNLDEAVRIMGKLQSNKDLTDEQVKSIVVFLKTLTGEQPKI
jgi:cytochrome c peroxidase